MRKLMKASVGAAMALSASASFAASVDFTDLSVWGGADGTSSFSAAGVTVTSTGGTITTNGADVGKIGGDCGTGNPSLHDLTCGGDGLGIRDDEISYGLTQSGEMMYVDLGAVYEINSIEFLDLFNPEGAEPEVAQFYIGSTLYNQNSLTQTGGYVKWTPGTDVIGQVLIFFTQTNPQSDFALARINYSEVPAPGALALFSIGLLGLGATRRRAKVSA